MVGNYGPPTSFNWEWGSTDEPFKDHPGWEEDNVAQRVQLFVSECMKTAASTRGNDIMLTMGTDFTYANAFVWCDGAPHHAVDFVPAEADAVMLLLEPTRGFCRFVLRLTHAYGEKHTG